MSDSVERLLVRIDATSEQLRRELKVADQAVGNADTSIGQRLSKMQKRFNDTAKVAAKFGAAAAAAGVAITTKLVSAGLESVDSLAKVSARLGIATEDLAALRFAAEQTGVSTQTLDMALQRMTRRVAEAAQGTGEAQGALKELGLSAEALNELAPDQTFRAITDAMEGVGNQSDRVRLAMKLFDSEGVSLVQTMQGGTAALDEFARQAEIAGLTISQFDAAKVEAANDAFNRVGKQVQGLGQQLAVRFAPILEAIADRFFGIGEEAGGMGNVASKVFNAIIKGAGMVGDAIRAMSVAWNGMQLVFQYAARMVLQGLDNLVKNAITLWNKLPWTDEVSVENMFGGFLATMDAQIAESKSKIDALLSKPLPSQAIEEWADVHTRSFQAAAIEVGKLDASTADLAITTNEAAESLAEDWDRALQGTFERIDSAFSQAWQGAFDSFSDFADGLKNAFKNLIGELAHLAITKPILLNIGAALGIGGASSGAMASTGLGSVFSGGGVSGLLGSFGNFGSGLYNTIGSGASFLADLGIPGMDSLSTAAFGKGMTATGLGTIGNLGAGLAGGLLGNAVFGETSGIGSTLGGIAGSFIPVPFLGTAIGSFLGAGIESLFGSRPKNNVSTTFFGPGGSNQLAFGNADNAGAVGTLGSSIEQMRALLGGSNTSIGVNYGTTGGLYLSRQPFESENAGPNFNGYTFQYGDDEAGFMRHAFNQLVEGATHLDRSLRDLLISFDGTAEEVGAYSQAMIGISTAVGSNVVRDVREAWAEMSGNTVVDAYQAQTDAMSNLIDNFDGSFSSAQQLNAALAQNQAAAAQLAGQILQLAQNLGNMFGQSAQQIRESVMTEEELFEARKNERDALRRAINTMTDPAEIERAAQEINRLNNLLFQSFDNPGNALAEQYATYAERTNEQVQQRLDTILNGIEQTQEAQNNRIQEMMESAAVAQQNAANTFASAASVIASAADAFAASARPASEVNA